MDWVLRAENPNAPIYDTNSSLFTIELHHGGKFLKNGDRFCSYIDGYKDYFDNCLSQHMSYSSLVGMIYSLGWLEVEKMYFKKVGSRFDTSLVEINSDAAAVLLINYLDKNRVIEIYCLCSEGGLEDNDSSSGDEDGDPNDNLEDVQCDNVEMFTSSDDDGGQDDGLVDLDVRFVASSSRPTTTDLPNEEDILNEGAVDSDESLAGSDNEEEVVADKEMIFGKADLTKVVFKVGMKFPRAEECKDAVKMYGFQNGKNIFFKRNSRQKIICGCKNANGCPWYMYASKLRDEETIQIKTYVEKHTCPRTQENSACKPKFLAKKYVEAIRMNPKWPVKNFQEQVARDLQCQVKMPKAYKAIKLAKVAIQGKSGDQYLHLWDYIEEVKISDPGTTAIMKIDENVGPNRESFFRRLYICWGSLKKGFLECRPLIGLDGCHLSGPQKGILLSAVAIDPNNCMYPFAYAVVDTEKYSTWKWFIRLICKDINIQRAEDYTIISDKQKGLIKAVNKLLPGIEHRYCARHLYNNFNILHKGIALKNLLEKAARATTVPHFESALEEMKQLDEEAYQWLVEKPGENWSRAHFSTKPKTGILLNNLCESFNSAIKEPRVKPIITMLEDIRMYLMSLVMRKKEGMKRCTHMSICPKIRKKIDILKQKSHDWRVYWNGDDEWETIGPHGDKYKVSITERSCGCRTWQLTGIPCVHAIASIYFQGREPEDFVHQCYSIETYNKVYSNCMHPMNGMDLWKKTNKPVLLPPPVSEVKLGRPKKVRRRGPDEPKQQHKLSKKGVVMKCTKCGKEGHNIRTCGKPQRVRVQGKVIRKSSIKAPIGLIDESASSEDDARNETVNETVNETANETVNEAIVNEKMNETVMNEQTNETIEDGNFWAGIDDHLWTMERQPILFSQPEQSVQNETTQDTRQVSTQPPRASSKIKAKLTPVRKSSRIANSPNKGAPKVDFLDLTKAQSGKIHAGILDAPVPPTNLKKGQFFKGGKMYLTVEALKAEMELKKKAKKS